MTLKIPLDFRWRTNARRVGSPTENSFMKPLSSKKMGSFPILRSRKSSIQNNEFLDNTKNVGDIESIVEWGPSEMEKRKSATQQKYHFCPTR